MKKRAGQQMLMLTPPSTASIHGGWEYGRQLQCVARALFSLALATGGLLICAFAEFHAPTSLIDAFLPRW